MSTATTITTNNSENEFQMSKWPTEKNRATNKIKQSILRKCILPLTSKLHKGSSGRIGVLGGSEQYTGAPYYAAMSSLYTGSDLAFIFCAQEASIPIKCYSPECMVTSVYNTAELNDPSISKDFKIKKMVQKVQEYFARLHVLIIGPGLGRHPLVLEATAQIIKLALEESTLSLVLDADALFLLSLPEYHTLLQYAPKHNNIVVLTPNAMEYQRLKESFKSNLENFLNGTILIQKNEVDKLSWIQQQSATLVCSEEGSMKRSGGIGDVLAGCVGTLLAWNLIFRQRKHDDTDALLSCWVACCIVKRATFKAYEKKKRSMMAPDILKEIGEVFEEMMTLDENDNDLAKL